MSSKTRLIHFLWETLYIQIHSKNEWTYSETNHECDTRLKSCEYKCIAIQTNKVSFFDTEFIRFVAAQLVSINIESVNIFC